MRIIFTVFMTVVTVSYQAAPDNSNLVAVIQVFRHGHRAPADFYPNDPYANRSFWNGVETGQLTNLGKRQHEELGKFTRNRYRKWLPKDYDRRDFYVETTDVDRTHQSAQCNIYGIYPAKGIQVWKRSLDWQPIPVRVADEAIWNNAAMACTNYVKEYVNLLASEKYLKLNQEYDELFSYLTKHTGTTINTLTSATTIYDCLKSEQIAGYKLPKWTESVFPKPLTYLYALLLKSFTDSPKLQKLGIGPFVNAVVEHFETMAKNASVSHKYKIYSGHDLNIITILNTFNALNPPYTPAFASSLYFELRKNKAGEYYVNLWNKNNDDFTAVSINGCALDCPLQEIRTRLADVIVDPITRNVECERAARTLFTTPGDELYYKLLEEGTLDKLFIS